MWFRLHQILLLPTESYLSHVPSLNQFCYVILSHPTALVMKLAAYWRLKDNKAVAAEDFNAAQPKAC